MDYTEFKASQITEFKAKLANRMRICPQKKKLRCFCLFFLKILVSFFICLFVLLVFFVCFLFFVFFCGGGRLGRGNIVIVYLMERGQDSLQESVLSYYVGPGDGSLLVKLALGIRPVNFLSQSHVVQPGLELTVQGKLGLNS